MTFYDNSIFYKSHIPWPFPPWWRHIQFIWGKNRGDGINIQSRLVIFLIAIVELDMTNDHATRHGLPDRRRHHWFGSTGAAWVPFLLGSNDRAKPWEGRDGTQDGSSKLPLADKTHEFREKCRSETRRSPSSSICMAVIAMVDFFLLKDCVCVCFFCREWRLLITSSVLKGLTI